MGGGRKTKGTDCRQSPNINASKQLTNIRTNIQPRTNTLQQGEGILSPPLSCCANAHEGGNLDTLAQLGKRARAKYVLRPLLLALIDQAKQDPEGQDMWKSYWNSYHCAGTLEQKGQKLEGKYCNQRWCLVCSRIRMAKSINKYKPFYQQMSEPQMVTLTDRTVTPEYLPYRLIEFKLAINQIVSVMKKRGTPLVGIRKIEVTYNDKENRFHPHYHLLIDGEYEANVLVDEWLKRRKTASEKAQDITEIEDEKGLTELFKYTAKQCTKGKRVMNAEALHIIYKALRGVRTFQTMGGFGQGEVENEGEELKLYGQKYPELKDEHNYWFWEGCDWKNLDDKFLTGYIPSQAIEEFSKSIETKLCNVTSANNNSPPKTKGKNSVLMDAVNGRLNEEITMMITEEIPY